MNDTMKKAISELVAMEVAKPGMSQVKWGTMHKMSGATVSNVVNGKWENIAVSMWQRIAAAVAYKGRDWQAAPTRNYVAMQSWCRTAQQEGISLAVSHDSGAGKSFALEHYAKDNAEVYYIQCDEFWTKKLFLSNLCRALAIDPAHKTTPELADTIISTLRKGHKPLVILDEVDKLRDPLLMFFIALYNKLDGICGFVLVGAPYLSIAWERNARKDKRGFREIYSRVGRRFLAMKPIIRKDVELVCAANGVKDEAAINAIWNEVEKDTDLRRVRREVEKLRFEGHIKAA